MLHCLVSLTNLRCVYSAQLCSKLSFAALEESGCRPSLVGSSSRSHGMDLNYLLQQPRTPVLSFNEMLVSLCVSFTLDRNKGL